MIFVCDLSRSVTCSPSKAFDGFLLPLSTFFTCIFMASALGSKSLCVSSWWYCSPGFVLNVIDSHQYLIPLIILDHLVYLCSKLQLFFGFCRLANVSGKVIFFIRFRFCLWSWTRIIIHVKLFAYDFEEFRFLLTFDEKTSSVGVTKKISTFTLLELYSDDKYSLHRSLLLYTDPWFHHISHQIQQNLFESSPYNLKVLKWGYLVTAASCWIFMGLLKLSCGWLTNIHIFRTPSSATWINFFGVKS